MDLGLAGKVAVVSGGASGIGAALVSALKYEGAIVEVIDIATIPSVDISDRHAVSERVAEIMETHGQIDLVYSNAGLLKAGATEEFPVETFDRIMAVNARGAFLLAQATIPHLRTTRGALVFTASTSAIVGAEGEAAYAASKAAIAGLARSLAAELAGDGIRVNAIAPGWVDTPFNDPVWAHAGGDKEQAIREQLAGVPMRRQADPAEIVPTLLLMGSPASGYMTGQVVAIDGGLSTLR
ncbi:SDR family oxidoreductase [Mameliella alba]|uniref:SDR family NAD(P)-dependent oxidoreductase n=1 Tax=Mameliella alba TaxID=561184 RepID=UPI001C95E57F|nr:SDR family oxidoreductase [Mameliella alba]MBY6120394.1 SDR family oxidoreductase [Mameliella alba]